MKPLFKNPSQRPFFVNIEHFVHASCGCLKTYLMGKKGYALLYLNGIMKFLLNLVFVVQMFFFGMLVGMYYFEDASYKQRYYIGSPM